MAKASAETGATLYVAEGQPVPDDVPEGVRLVGPGAAVPEPEGQAIPEPEAEDVPEPEPVPAPPPASAPKAVWVDHAEASGVPRDEAEAMTKAALIETAKGGM